MAHLTIDFFSNCLRRTVQFQMIIPGDFCNTWQIEQKRKGKRMKTLFLLHGYTGAAENWVPDNLSTLYNFAIVMPSGENGFWVDGPATGPSSMEPLSERNCRITSVRPLVLP